MVDEIDPLTGRRLAMPEVKIEITGKPFVSDPDAKRAFLADQGKPTTVQITVTCECGEILGVWENVIDERYPFWCEACDEYKRGGRYPWKLTTEVLP